MHIGGQLVAPEGAAVGKLGRLGAATKAQQVDGVHLMALGQHGNVVAPVVRGSTKAMHQQDRRALGLSRRRCDGVHWMAGVAPGLGYRQGSHLDVSRVVDAR